MGNTIDITDCSDNVLDIYLRAKGGEDGIVVEHLTPTERRQLAELMGWTRTASLAHWVAAPPQEAAPAGGPDYESAILARQEAR